MKDAIMKRSGLKQFLNAQDLYRARKNASLEMVLFATEGQFVKISRGDSNVLALNRNVGFE